ncbi:MAG TPA: hypothetical protein VFN49_06535 [Candidatus Aquilonibacter sp.]|nr:hypothetical protein [Candidatus Aquilonibacter sp.]
MSQTYATLADSITHNKPQIEKSILAPRFTDRAKIKLNVYEYDPLTVLVEKIDAKSQTTLVVHAQWVGIGKNRENTVDRWLRMNGSWRLVERDQARP